MNADTGNPASATGLLAGLRALAGNGFGLLLCRLELAGMELSEARNHLLKLAGFFALALLAAWFAIAYGTILIVALLWASLGWKILLIMTLVFTALAAVLLRHAWLMIRQDRLNLPLTMAELRSDRDQLI